jgi:SMODS domain-containing protein
MSLEHVGHKEIAKFAEEKVNLKSDTASTYRAQAGRVRDHIQRYINDNPGIGFVKTLLSGSLAKHTSLKTLNDIDIALYIKDDKTDIDINDILQWVYDKLSHTYPTTQIKIDPPCVVISFSGTELDVDVMPVIYDGDENGYGKIFDPYTLETKYTSIPRHLEFITKRRTQQPKDFAQIIRLIKFWRDSQGLDFRSFLIELIVSDCADQGIKFTDYPSALLNVFNRILNDDLNERIIFEDYFSKDKFPAKTDLVAIFDPVEPTNNVAENVSKFDLETFLELVENATEQITYAKNATTKEQTVQCWRNVFGPTFNA